MENIGRWAMAIALPGIMAVCFGCTRRDTGDERDRVWVDHPEKVSDETERRVRTLNESITEELRGLGDHAWAGKFYEGDGTEENVTLLIAPERVSSLNGTGARASTTGTWAPRDRRMKSSGSRATFQTPGEDSGELRIRSSPSGGDRASTWSRRTNWWNSVTT